MDIRFIWSFLPLTKKIICCYDAENDDGFGGDNYGDNDMDKRKQSAILT